MTTLHLVLHPEPLFPDVDPQDIVTADEDLWIGGLEAGMASGEPSVVIRVNLREGGVVLAQTSLRMLLAATDGLRARFGDPR